MINLTDLYINLKETGIDFFTGVPDSLLNDFCLYLCEHIPADHHIMAANEGNAIAIAAGYNIATGKIPVVYMQNSGIGNATNPLLSLTHTDVYSIPMILLIGWRGDPDVKDHAQHKKQGELTPILLKDMDIPYAILDCEETVPQKFKWAKSTADASSAPVALIVKKGILSKKEKIQSYPSSTLLNREDVIRAVLDIFGENAIYLATTGRATRELHEQMSLHNIPRSQEFLNVGSMGHLSSIGLGLAVGAPHKKIVLFDGDSAAIMHMGSLATVGKYQPNNLIHIVLNNGANESVGGQPSPGQVISLTAVAEACGYTTIGRPICKEEELKDTLNNFFSLNKPCFIDMRIKQGIRSDMPKLSINHRAAKAALSNELRKEK